MEGSRMTAIRRPFLVSDRTDEIGEIRNRADRLQKRCAELASELAELLDQTLDLALIPGDEPPALLSVQDCALLLGLSRTMVFSLIRDGALRSVKVGTRRLVPRAAIECFVSASSSEPAAIVANFQSAV
jgi:excisionase family DNA binding protein